MTTDWTPRERQLRAALEPFAAQCEEMQNEAHRALQFGGYLPIDQPDISIDMWAAHAIKWKHLIAARDALSTPPPPDPRDEALRLAEQCLSNIKDDLIRSINQTTLCHHGPINDREREAAALCCGEGYGNMMSILSTQWHLSVGGGAFVVGECVTTAQNQVKDIEAALAAIAAVKGEPDGTT